jgi:glycosyltransferase involved in cell wall biosynthesis
MMRALQRVLVDQSLREKLRQAGYEQVKRFSWEHSVSEILASYQQVAMR